VGRSAARDDEHRAAPALWREKPPLKRRIPASAVPRVSLSQFSVAKSTHAWAQAPQGGSALALALVAVLLFGLAVDSPRHLLALKLFEEFDRFSDFRQLLGAGIGQQVGQCNAIRFGTSRSA
jgi:hypothetical protein